jgi:hypothetical protein
MNDPRQDAAGIVGMRLRQRIEKQFWALCAMSRGTCRYLSPKWKAPDFSTQRRGGAILNGRVSVGRAMPYTPNVVFHELSESRYQKQRPERQVNQSDLFREIGPVLYIVYCPSNRTGAQDVKRHSNHDAHDQNPCASSGLGWCYRLFHEAALNIPPASVYANQI